jgi:uncharacterized protein YdeI (BOF family)
MNKRFLIVAGMVALAAVAVSAQGRPGMGQYGAQGPQQGAMQGPGGSAGRGGMMGGATWDDVEETSLAGRLVLAEDEFPVLSSGGEEYSLRIHPALSSEVTVRNGQQVSVEGFVREFQSFDLMGTERIVHVTAMEVDGTRVVLPDGWGGPGDGLRGESSSRGGSPRGQGNR